MIGTTRHSRLFVVAAVCVLGALAFWATLSGHGPGVETSAARSDRRAQGSNDGHLSRAGEPNAEARDVEREPRQGAPAPTRTAAPPVEAVEVERRIGLVVRDAKTFDPIEGATLTRVRPSSIEVAATASDANGRMTLRWKGAAPQGAHLHADRYQDARLPSFGTLALEADRTILLEPSATVAVHPTGFGGTTGEILLAPGHRVHRFDLRNIRLWHGEDVVTFDDVEPGLVSVVVTVEGEPPASTLGAHAIAGKVTDIEVRAVPSGMFSGKVVEIESERPMSGVGVTIQPERSGLDRVVETRPFERTYTDARGRFSVPGTPTGRMRAHFFPPDGLHVEREVVIAEGDITRERTFRIRGYASLTGRIDVPADVEPSSVEVAAVAKGDARRLLGMALLDSPLERSRAPGVLIGVDEQGRFHAGSVPAARPLVVIARVPGMQLAHAEIAPPLDSGEERGGVVLRVGPPDRYEFRVVDQAGIPVGAISASVEEGLAGRYAWKKKPPMERADGQYDVLALSPSPRRVRIRADGYASLTARLERGATYELRRSRRVHFDVVGSHGRAVHRAHLVATEIDDDHRDEFVPQKRRAVTDPFGRAAMELDPALRWRVRAEADGYLATDAGTIEPTDEAPASFPLPVVLEAAPKPEPARVTGRLVRAGTGAPLAGLEFRGLRGGTFSSDGAEFELRSIPPGPVRIIATSRGFEDVRLPVDELGAGESIDVGEIRVHAATRLDVLVVDARGDPVENANVRLVRLPASKGGRADLPRRVRLEKVRGRAGLYRREAIARVEWRLVVDHGSKRRARRTVNVTGARKRVRVQLEAD